MSKRIDRRFWFQKKRGGPYHEDHGRESHPKRGKTKALELDVYADFKAGDACGRAESWCGGGESTSRNGCTSFRRTPPPVSQQCRKCRAAKLKHERKAKEGSS